MIANGSFYITAVDEYARYAIACSAGSTIAMGKDGRTLESVVVKFYKLSTDGVMTPFAAPTAEARRTSRDGTTSLPRMHAGKAEVDLTDWVNGFAAGTLASVEVSVYGDGGELLARESFAAVYPGDDAEVWFITLSDAYYNVDAKGSVSAKLAGTLYHRKGGTTEPAGGAVLKFGYSDGITNTVTTGRDGRFDDSGWFAGDVWDDASTANSSKSIYVSYERDGVVETSQLVTLSRDGGQGEPGTPGADGQGYALHLTTGPAVQMTAYAGLKGGTVGVYLTKDGAAVNASFKVELYGDASGTGDPVANTDGYMIEAPVFNVGQLINAAVGGGKAPYLVTASAKVGGAVVAADRFSIVYDTAQPFVRTEEWSEELAFRNGDIIRCRKEATAGAAAKDYVFQWNYPVGGNSAVNPFDDVRDNQETTHWADYEYYALLATRVLLADNAFIAGWTFMNGRLYSQDGKCFLDGEKGQISLTGTVRNMATHLTAANVSEYVSQDSFGYEYIDFTKVGNMVWVDEDMDVGGLFMFPAFTEYHGLIGGSYDEVRSWVGSRFMIYNNMQTKELSFTGALTKTDSYYVTNFNSFVLEPGEVGFFECRLGSASDGTSSTEQVYWFYVKAKFKK